MATINVSEITVITEPSGVLPVTVTTTDIPPQLVDAIVRSEAAAEAANLSYLETEHVKDDTLAIKGEIESAADTFLYTTYPDKVAQFTALADQRDDQLQGSYEFMLPSLITYRDAAQVARNEAEAFRDEAEAFAAILETGGGLTTDEELASAVSGIQATIDGLDYYSQAEVDAANAALTSSFSTALLDHPTLAGQTAYVAGELSSYYLKSEIDSAITAATGAVDLSGMYTKAESDAKYYSRSQADARYTMLGATAPLANNALNLGGKPASSYLEAGAADVIYLTNTNAASTYQPQSGMTDYYTKAESDALVGGVDLSGYHTIAAFNTAMSSVYTAATVDSRIATEIGNIDYSGIYDDFYLKTDTYSQAEVDSALLSYLTSADAATTYLGATATATDSWSLGGKTYDKFFNNEAEIVTNLGTELRKGFRGPAGNKAALAGAYAGAAFDIWSASTQNEGGNYDDNYLTNSPDKTGLSWFMPNNLDSAGMAGQGLYVLTEGVIHSGIGADGVFTKGDVIAEGDVSAFSDSRLKEDFVPFDEPTVMLKALMGFNYNRVDLDRRQDGLIAQDVQSVLPDSVKENAAGLLAVNYNGVVALLVEAVNELTARVEELERRNG